MDTSHKIYRPGQTLHVPSAFVSPIRWIVGAVALSLSSCAIAPVPKPSTPAASTPAPVASSPSVRSTPNQAPTRTKTTTVNLYKVDSQCQNLVLEKATLDANRSIDVAIAKVLEERDTGDFTVAGYRVSVRNGVATVDLRLPANAKRRFVSLSTCEQLALFGSIRKTLTSNRQWKIKSVRFTEKGQPIVL